MTFFDDQQKLSSGKPGCRFDISGLVFGPDEQQINFFKKIIEKHNVNTVLDVFCENPDLAILLARWGKTVTALVPEPVLKRKIGTKSDRAGVRLNACLGDMRDIYNLYHKQCDLIVCLQNSLALLLNKEDIWGTLAQMYLKLEPGGVLVIHTFNYDRLLKAVDSAAPVLSWQHRGLKIKLLFKQDKGGDSADLIFKVFPEGVPGGQKIVYPVWPILTKELNLWLAELGFEKIKNYDWYDGKTFTCNGYHRITVACRPDAAE
ncbi:MAG: class I SAM-dependent methyltransferase [Firmicutes bacterium]|nr:class I SAM-dependent methyltransferase [Bacillota bacterium]